MTGERASQMSRKPAASPLHRSINHQREFVK